LVTSKCVIYLTVSLVTVSLWGCMSRLGYPFAETSVWMTIGRYLIMVERSDSIRIATHKVL